MSELRDITRDALDAYALTDLAWLEGDQRRMGDSLTALDLALYRLAVAVGMRSPALLGRHESGVFTAELPDRAGRHERFDTPRKACPTCHTLADEDGYCVDAGCPMVGKAVITT